MVITDAASVTAAERGLRAYFCAKSAVMAAGFSDEIDYHDCLSFEELSECDFLREAAWVIMSSGMRESVISRKFARISDAFLNWTSGRAIYAQRDYCRTAALEVFAHSRKIEAILEVASAVAAEGFADIRHQIKKAGASYLRRFSYMGPATSLHLAKNLGLNVVKPDRHLVRIAAVLGYGSPGDMCHQLASVLGEKICVIDVVFWRFATLDSHYIAALSGTPCDSGADQSADRPGSFSHPNVDNAIAKERERSARLGWWRCAQLTVKK